MKETLIDRYVQAVGRRLPGKTRADVQLELRTALLDAAEQRGLNPAAEHDQAGIITLLKEYGRPEAMAASYGVGHSLIHPQVMPAYRRVLAISGGLITLIHLVGLMLVIGNTGFDFTVGDVIANYIKVILMSFGAITIVFAVIDRTLPDLQIEEPEWDPATLPALLPQADRLDYADTVAELITQVALVGVFTSLPWDITLPGGPSWALIHDVLTRLTALLPWFIALSAADVIIQTAKLFQGRWTRFTRWATVLQSLAAVGLLGYVTGQIIRILQPAPGMTACSPALPGPCWWSSSLRSALPPTSCASCCSPSPHRRRPSACPRWGNSRLCKAKKHSFQGVLFVRPKA
ncbi:MAG: hypothetical protein KIS88_08940 [Anaerolineales bacterium]|nr:hypothetical protein [Anaerolineales bacterium]